MPHVDKRPSAVQKVRHTSAIPQPSLGKPAMLYGTRVALFKRPAVQEGPLAIQAPST